MGLATLEDVEESLRLGLDAVGLGGVFAEDERAGDEADDEGDEDGGDHRLFGNEFDADERAEVGWGLRGGEAVDGDIPFDEAGTMDCLSENLLIEQVELRVETDGCQFVEVHQKLSELTKRRPINAVG